MQDQSAIWQAKDGRAFIAFERLMIIDPTNTGRQGGEGGCRAGGGTRSGRRRRPGPAPVGFAQLGATLQAWVWATGAAACNRCSDGRRRRALPQQRLAAHLQARDDPQLPAPSCPPAASPSRSTPPRARSPGLCECGGKGRLRGAALAAGPGRLPAAPGSPPCSAPPRHARHSPDVC